MTHWWQRLWQRSARHGRDMSAPDAGTVSTASPAGETAQDDAWQAVCERLPILEGLDAEALAAVRAEVAEELPPAVKVIPPSVATVPARLPAVPAVYEVMLE